MNDKLVTIATHNGIFHADDVMALAILARIFPNHSLVRGRDPETIRHADIVVDVGGIYNEGSMRFDHHQREGAGERPNGVSYSSCGLVWKRFGAEICANQFPESAESTEELFNMIDKGIISSIDIIDCQGMKSLGIPENTPFFSLSHVLSGFNGSSPFQDEAFRRACLYAHEILHNEIKRCVEVIRGQSHLKDCMETCKGGKVLILESFVPGWAQSGKVKKAGFTRVIFPDLSGAWCCQVVPDTSLLPEVWKGLEGEELSKVTNIPGSTFCHKGRFIAGHSTRYGALSLAFMSL